ncbi:hypothetical protein [Ornithinibacillus scapharcae]|uniref:hypothetical protein n=1 Tax=Ornithinibacillus scapharcae TaxID=1147159 RepID=UPI00110F7B94|nr:hypothetical protein [Ornithinibacillus scapharcae]
MIFMILGPVMVALYLIPQTKDITLGWIREFIGTVLVQAVHAITFFLIAVLSITADGTIESVMLYVIFIPVGEAVKGIFGLTNNTQGALGKATTFSGLAALGGVIGATKGAISGKSVSGALQSMKNGAQTGAKTGKSDDGSN